ncbi:hypothetical protein ACE1CD_13520 [Aerosakkonema sp. BLCC-F183]|uniref:hypothetical protein n=1 Tax=Aerosakkonema sp. BLCC-F183 TaxID=3342834 RepID=UPI0035B9DE44
MPPIPPYLVFLTVVLVVLPSVIAILLRLALHQHLVQQVAKVKMLVNGNTSIKEPRIVENLKSRFKEASSNLEQVNTAALIDQVYSQEKVAGISSEQIDYFCRILPNLLLAFGLLGTFLGITINLTALSQTIAQPDASNVSTLVQKLQEPLQGMGIAFTTSLTGIFFSALLTVINFLFNTNLAKYQLITSLEDYLDNVYHPTLQGQTRLDKIVKGMADSFDHFLTRFGQTVREAVESSLKAKLQEIFDANIEATKLAKEVYTRLAESSGTISSGANQFKISANELGNAVAAMMTTADRFNQVAETFEHSQFPHRLADATADLASTQADFSQSASILAESVQSIKKALKDLRLSSQQLLNLQEEVSNINQNSGQFLELHQNHQKALDEIVVQLQQRLPNFQSVAELQQQIISKSDNLDKVQVELTNLVVTLREYTDGVTLGIQSVSDRISESINNQSENTNSQIKIVIENIQQGISHLNDTKYELYRLRQTLEKRSPKDIDEAKLDEIVDKLNKI